MPTQHTPTQLKQLLAAMLPDELTMPVGSERLYKRSNIIDGKTRRIEEVLDTELDYLCRVVEEKLTDEQMLYFWELLCEVKQKEPLARIVSRPPSQRIPCLAKVLNITI